jgi:hypothetical protein
LSSTIECSGRVRVPLPPDAVIHYFTPEGERDWVPGWDPAYPAGAPAELAPGLVFETEAHGPRTTWVVTGAAPREVAYCRVVPGGPGRSPSASDVTDEPNHNSKPQSRSAREQAIWRRRPSSSQST